MRGSGYWIIYVHHMSCTLKSFFYSYMPGHFCTKISKISKWIYFSRHVSILDVFKYMWWIYIQDWFPEFSVQLIDWSSKFGQFFTMNIRIYHKCAGGIVKVRPEDGRSCRVITNGDPGGRIFLFNTHTNYWFIFLFSINFLFWNKLQEVS